MAFIDPACPLQLSEEEALAVFEALWEFTEKRDDDHPTLHAGALRVRERLALAIRHARRECVEGTAPCPFCVVGKA
jgi:hypothetical protein